MYGIENKSIRMCWIVRYHILIFSWNFVFLLPGLANIMGPTVQYFYSGACHGILSLWQLSFSAFIIGWEEVRYNKCMGQLWNKLVEYLISPGWQAHKCEIGLHHEPPNGDNPPNLRELLQMYFSQSYIPCVVSWEKRKCLSKS